MSKNKECYRKYLSIAGYETDCAHEMNLYFPFQSLAEALGL